MKCQSQYAASAYAYAVVLPVLFAVLICANFFVLFMRIKWDRTRVLNPKANNFNAIMLKLSLAFLALADFGAMLGTSDPRGYRGVFGPLMNNFCDDLAISATLAGISMMLGFWYLLLDEP